MQGSDKWRVLLGLLPDSPLIFSSVLQHQTPMLLPNWFAIEMKAINTDIGHANYSQ